MHQKPENLLSQTQLAASLGVSSRTVQRYVRLGKIPVHRIGPVPVFRWSEVAAALSLGEGPGRSQTP
ncbi:helix-turn-helix domain-containing protein [Thioclava sp. F42-5]|uniref:helix-turn-helix transcriptional regulator n=1 Tax=Thioclava sp. F42-5 TaxID=1973005 RepID=UPI0011BAA76B|nr:helix-turn-helix domain-containing protein [Thioclava sp. F42-5]